MSTPTPISKDRTQSPPEDRADGLFRPERHSKTVENITPQRRAAQGPGSREGTKRISQRVWKAMVDCQLLRETEEIPCMLLNVGRTQMLEFAHCIPRTTEPDILTCLEYYWGLPYYTLNADSSRNIFCLNGNSHRQLDKHLWFPVPSKDVIDQFCAAKMHEKDDFDGIDGEVPPKGWEYSLIPTTSLEETPFTIEKPSTRPSTIPPRGAEACITWHEDSRGDFVRAAYPFYGLKFRSHVPPRYVIVRLGITVLKLFQKPEMINKMYASLDKDSKGQELLDLMEKCLGIYQCWTNMSGLQALGGFTEWKSTMDDSGPDGPDADGRTTRKRVAATHSSVISVRSVVPRKRTLPNSGDDEQAFGPPSSSLSFEGTGPSTPSQSSGRGTRHMILPQRSTRNNPSGGQGAGIPQQGVGSRTLPHASQHTRSSSTSDQRHATRGRGGEEQNRGSNWGPQDKRGGTTGGK